MKKSVRLIICFVCFILIVTLIPLSVFVISPRVEFKRSREEIMLEDAVERNVGADAIHFLSTGSSDAILIESQGHYALVDAGEDSDNPRGFEALAFEGFEERVLAYIKEYAADKNGNVHLDFVLGTHSHSDHIGGFDTVINDPAVSVDRAYLKEYDSSKIRDMELDEWDNQEVYDQMLGALKAKNIPVISKMDNTPFPLGNFTITLYNTDDPENSEKVGENDQSVGMLIEKNGTRIFLSGDIDNITGDEERLAPIIGKVDLLKVGHHSYSKSTTAKWLRALMPEYCVVTNDYDKLDMRTISRITRITSADIYVTGQENGIVAEIGDSGSISFYGNIHS